MRQLQRISKLYDAKAFHPVDFGPWLQQISDAVGTLTVGDAPDIVETYTVSGARADITFSGGLQGRTYRVPVTCVSAAKAIPRTVVIEVSIPGVASNTSPSESVVTGNVDGGTPGTNYGAVDGIDGGNP